LHDAVELWVGTLTEFLHPKAVDFRIGAPPKITSRSGKALRASVLSSGERQLILLLTHAFLMRSSGGLLLVDEPELSLNVVWQRKLISAMVDAFGSNPCQLVLASHSLEIAAQFEDSLVTLA